MLSSLGKHKGARLIDCQAVAALIEQAARQVRDQEKVLTHAHSCVDLVCESDYYAKVDGSQVTHSAHDFIVPCLRVNKTCCGQPCSATSCINVGRYR
jgi:predicted ATP-dependent protease